MQSLLTFPCALGHQQDINNVRIMSEGKAGQRQAAEWQNWGPRLIASLINP